MALATKLNYLQYALKLVGAMNNKSGKFDWMTIKDRSTSNMNFALQRHKLFMV